MQKDWYAYSYCIENLKYLNIMWSEKIVKINIEKNLFYFAQWILMSLRVFICPRVSTDIDLVENE